MKRKLTILTAALALLMALGIPLTGWGQTTTYELQQVTSVQAGDMYVFVQSGHAMNNTVSSSALQTTDSYNTTGLTGTESYVWTLETATDGFYMKNVSITSYINNASGTNMSFGNKSSIWTFAFTDGVALISNKSNANRFLGYTNATSYAYKAYASSNLSSYAHDITVYKLVEESTPTCIAPTFSPVAGTYTSAQNVTISTTTSGATIYYTTNGTNPTTSSSVYSTPIAISENTTIKAMAVKSGYNNSPIATAEYTIELPLSTMQAIFDRATAVGTTATSVNIALQNWVVSGVSTNGKNVFVTDGSKGFVIFNSSGDMGFAVGNVLSGTVSCKVQLYNGFAEITQLNSTTSGISVATGGTVTAAEIEMADLDGVNTGALVSYENLTCTVNNTGSSPIYYLSDGTTTVQVFGTLYAFGALEHNHTYNITGVYQQYNTTKEILPRDADDIEDVTAGPVIDYAELPVIFDGGKNDLPLGFTPSGLGNDYNSSPHLCFDSQGDNLILKLNTPVTKLCFNIKFNTVKGTFKVQTSSDGTEYDDLDAYIYNPEGTGTNVATSTKSYSFESSDDVKYIKWVFSEKTNGKVALGYIRVSDNDLDIFTDTTLENLNIGAGQVCTVYRPATLTVTGSITNSNTTNLIINDGGQVKCNSAFHGTLKKNITGYSSYTGTGNGGYYLMGTPSSVYAFGQLLSGMDNAKADIYTFNGAEQGQEWRNAKANVGGGGVVVGGTNGGFLFAYQDDCELSIPSNMSPTNTGVEVGLTYVSNVEAPFNGYNLIGNPFTCKAYLADGRDFYRMNPAGDAIVLAAANQRAIDVCEGIFVVTTTGGNVTFQTTEPEPGDVVNNSMIDLNITQDCGALVDNARVRFDDCQMLPKFYFMGNNSGLFIPQGDKDYAVVRSNAQGELPVSFKAAKNGSYTLSVNPENVTMNYLHLIDNMTGANIDLLANPSYTFNANTNDYTSRFRLVFSANANVNENGEAAETTFAYNNGSEWVILNEGEATLQVIDVMGRILRSESINGSANVNVNAAPGVYVLRLINGDNVRTQKVVVR